ncbi:predicted protein [Nematostella vectensis]|uniref:F5/8 type C domain-containing protein n=1 Tax=Nematostella vectensis TaxID=45351 RepID=A7RXG1_NEMVE|nr:predicted protein [Nematostella vectensis]|eukprot:XP_001635831.1 predicted protein [Nematostella vectensis]
MRARLRVLFLCSVRDDVIDETPRTGLQCNNLESGAHLMRILIVLTTLLATCSASKSSSIPLYRKDLPYCASSLVYLSGDDKVREVWSIKDGGDYTLDLRTHTSSYCPHDRNVTAVQFDLGRMKRIAGVLVTGKRQEETPLDKYDIDTLPPWTEDMWVYYATHYTVEHSPDSRIWTEIKDELGNPRVRQIWVDIKDELGNPRIKNESGNPGVRRIWVEIKEELGNPRVRRIWVDIKDELGNPRVRRIWVDIKDELGNPRVRRIWVDIKDESGNPRHFKMTQSYEEAAAIKSKWEIFIRAHLQTFDPNIHARFIRINVQAFIKKGCIGRVDVIGCDSDLSTNNVQRVEVAEPSKIERGECSHVSTLGMQSGEITDGQIEASSFDHYSYPGFARWDNPHQMQWCANTSHDKSPWIMVGFPTSRFLTKVLYKGEIKGYKVDIELTLDGKTWTKYESRSRSFFSATLCCGFHEEFYIYPVIKVRYVRLAFKRDWYGPYKACAMFEVFGCSAETQTLSWFPPLIARVKPHIEISPGTWDRKDVRYMAMGEDPYLSYCFKTSKIYFDFGNPSFKEPTYNRVEFDMKKMFALTKVIIRGDLSPSKECGPYVKSMAIMYSMDRTTWTMVRYYNGKNDWRLRIKVHYLGFGQNNSMLD